jgi:hypothetical protein
MITICRSRLWGDGPGGRGAFAVPVGFAFDRRPGALAGAESRKEHTYKFRHEQVARVYIAREEVGRIRREELSRIDVDRRTAHKQSKEKAGVERRRDERRARRNTPND